MVSVPEGLAFIAGAAVGAAVGAGTDVALGGEVELVDGTAVGAVDGAVDGAAGKGVAAADEPQARITANRRAKGPRIIAYGFFNQ